jgi:hypothetical protein
MSRQRYFNELIKQLRFIQTSCAVYDAGLEDEACRLAVALRVLFHKTPRSTPLLAHLKMENSLMLSSSVGHNDWRDYVAMRINLGSATPVSCQPKLGSKFSKLPLHKWWHEQIVHSFEGRAYYRRDLILAAANKDGGAHVDKLQQFYEDLASGKHGLSFHGKNLIYPKGAPFDQSVEQSSQNTHFAMIRQFAHEVLHSASYFKWLVVKTPTSHGKEP